MSFTYAQLKTALQDYTENTETSFVANLPLFIRAAEERILKSVQLNLFRKNVSGFMSIGNKFLAAPSDFLAPYSLSYTSGSEQVFVEFKDVSFIQTYNPDATVTGLPKYYSSFDVSNFILAPTPNASFVAELHYLYRPASLTAGSESGTTWLSENAELSLLYASLIEAYIFMKGEQDVMAMYDKRYQESLVGLKLLGEAKETTQDYRVGRIIRPKQ
jgi:hypothetical protein|tara:strand:- start:698 stop:1345 length:648 start_codon:yes stop_codon:yes gene_type:complete